MKAILRKIQISPKKMNVVAGLVRQKNANEALEFLKFLPKKAGKILWKTLHSAVANAENNGGENRENLKIKKIVINKGPVLRRHLPSARGRALPIRKPSTHIFIELEKK